MFCIACHSFYRIQIPIQRPQESFLVHATVFPYSFHFFSAFRECDRANIFSFTWTIEIGNFCWEKKQKTPFKLFFPRRKRVFKCLFERWKTFENLLQRKETLYTERYNNHFNHRLYRAQGIHFDYATPVLWENVNVHVQTMDKKHKNKFLSRPSTWAWSEQPTSLTVLSASERCTTTKSYVPTFASTNNFLNTRKRYYLYARNWNSKWNE